MKSCKRVKSDAPVIKSRRIAFVLVVIVVTGVFLVNKSFAEPDSILTESQRKAFFDSVEKSKLEPAQKQFIWDAFTQTYPKKKRLERLVIGTFHMMRLACILPANKTGCWVMLYDSPPQPQGADFELPVIAVFMRNRDLAGWQAIAPGSAGIISYSVKKHRFTIKTKANWIDRMNYFIYRRKDAGLELEASEIRPLPAKYELLLSHVQDDPPSLRRLLLRFRSSFMEKRELEKERKESNNSD